MQYILENYSSDREFCFIGHSLGGLIAMEVIHILEQHGKRGYIFLIESSPLFYHKLRIEQVEKDRYSKEEFLQNEICILTLQILSPTSVIKKVQFSLLTQKKIY